MKYFSFTCILGCVHLCFYDFAVASPTHYCDNKMWAVGHKIHTLLLSFSHLRFHFFSCLKFKVAGVCLVHHLSLVVCGFVHPIQPQPL